MYAKKWAQRFRYCRGIFRPANLYFLKSRESGLSNALNYIKIHPRSSENEVQTSGQLVRTEPPPHPPPSDRPRGGGSAGLGGGRFPISNEWFSATCEPISMILDVLKCPRREISHGWRQKILNGWRQTGPGLATAVSGVGRSDGGGWGRRPARRGKWAPSIASWAPLGLFRDFCTREKLARPLPPKADGFATNSARLTISPSIKT